MITNVQRFRWLLVVACVTALAAASQAGMKKRSKDDDRRTGASALLDESGAGRIYELGDGPEHPLEPGAPDELNRRGRHRGPHRPFFDRLPEEERERVSEFLREHFPDETRQLRLIKKSHPDRFDAFLDALMPEMLRLMRSRDRDPEDVFAVRVQMHKNEFKVRRALRRLSKTDDDQAPAWS